MNRPIPSSATGKNNCRWSWLVTVFLTWGLVVAVVGALLAGMMNQLTRSLWTAFLVWWNA